MQSYFYQIAEYLGEFAGEGEGLVLWYCEEESDAGTRAGGDTDGEPRYLRTITIELLCGGRHARRTLSLTGKTSEDRSGLRKALEILREHVTASAAALAQRTLRRLRSSEERPRVDLETASEDAEWLVCTGYADSLGTRHWFERRTVADTDAEFAPFRAAAARVPESAARAHVRAKKHRALLSPRALYRLLAAAGRAGAFSHRARRGAETLGLSPVVSLAEVSENGLVPRFNEEGELRAPRVPLIAEGRWRGALVSPRTAREFGAAGNAASDDECPRSLALDAGTIDSAASFELLERGLFIADVAGVFCGDPAAASITCGTGDDCYAVERGTVRARTEPLELRIDLTRLFGADLLGLTRERELLLSPDAPWRWQNSSALLPGALVKAVRVVA
ncbi:MAG: metallopeptidase TldD-related protein [Planctomycetes bacterium]|nr:metallopeptidase TldD-related protein [Planctomycetota bacterium]